MEKETCTGCGCELTDKNRASLYLEHFRHICTDCFKRECDEDQKRLDDEMLEAAVPRCRVEGCGKELTDENWSPGSRRAGNYMCRECDSKRAQKWNAANHERMLANQERYSRNHGHLSMHENKKCALHLGVDVAEELVHQYYNDVVVMPHGNPGFDMICNRGKLIDVKASCLIESRRWIFHIRRNTIADYFVCVAYDNRKDLNVIHVWMIPGKVLSHLTGASISSSNVDKWSQYEQDTSKIAACCNAMKE